MVVKSDDEASPFRSLNNNSDKLARESDVTVSSNTAHTEYKGFAIYVLSGLSLTIWMLWTFTPNNVLNAFGIYYYPSRWWAVAIPSFILMSMLYIYIALALYNAEVKTLPLDDLRTLVDDHAIVAGSIRSVDGQLMDEKDFDISASETYIWKASSGVWDLPITLVNKVLYSDVDSD